MEHAPCQDRQRRRGPGLRRTCRSLPVALVGDDLGERLAGLGGPWARPPRLLIRISQRNRGPDQALAGDAEDSLYLLASSAGEPADAGSDPVCRRGEHDPLAEAALVERLHLRALAIH